MKYIIWPILILLIFIRYITSVPVFGEGDRVRISSVIYSDPVRYSGSQYIKIAGLKTYLPLTPEIFYGDKVIIEGVVNKDQLKNPKIVSVNPNASPLSIVRKSIIQLYNSILPEPESGLLSGIVLGSKSTLSADFYNQTKLAGVAHVVVASGTNVTFVIAFLSAFIFVFLPRRKAIPFVIVGIILYLFISGFEAPLIRAAIMSGMVFLTQETGRVLYPWRIFLFTAGVMLIIKPEWTSDVGFYLSFASTGSMMLLQKKIVNILRNVPAMFKEDLATTLSAQVGVTPILFVTFGQFNIWSPLINLLVLWTVPPLMIIGSIGGMVGLIFPALGKIVVLFSYPLLWWFVRIVQLFN